ncbi:MAG: sulfatase-like hydrolase/transferase [Kiritimatiellae bacterium]|nr:sulfatase-like hydrolase/transferase [Kiritimatiellia bacterium]
MGAIGAARAWPQAGLDPRARPNLLWITCEDMSPWLGFCGDPYARTPDLDWLARENVHSTRPFATAPVSARARFTTISGCTPTRRAPVLCAPPIRHRAPPACSPNCCAAGDHCTNNVKADYNSA